MMLDSLGNLSTLLNIEHEILSTELKCNVMNQNWNVIDVVDFAHIFCCRERFLFLVETTPVDYHADCSLTINRIEIVFVQENSNFIAWLYS